MATLSDNPMIGKDLGPYRVLERVGAGGMGEVYRAHDAKLNRDVAIKILPQALTTDPVALARFEREAQALAALSHPNILAIFDFGRDGETVYAVMELLEGETLRERLAHGALSGRKAVELGVQIAEGLAAAHDKGIVHRDLKPENIFVTKDGRAKVLDFGLAKQAGAAADAQLTMQMTALRTGAGLVLGTAAYMSPEQVRGDAVDHRSDIFSFGAVLHEMLAGRQAFGRETATESMTAILKDEAPDIVTAKAGTRSLAGLQPIVRHCLEKKPGERFQSAHDIAFALQALSGSSVSSAGIVPSIAKRGVPRWVVTGALALAAATLAVGLDRALAPASPVRASFTMKTFEQQIIMNARFMPDGQTLVFSAAPSGNAPQLYDIRPGALEARSFGPPRTHLLSVSSRGELAVLIDTRFINHYLFAGTLARMSVDGSPQPWMENVREADWSPDGSALAIVHDIGSQDRLEFPVRKVLYQTTGYFSDPRVSPDGTRVAFMDHQNRYDDRGWVKVVDTSGVVTTLAGEFWGEQGLAWSRDGSALFFSAAAAGEGHIDHPTYQVQSVRVASPGAVTPALTTPGDFIIRDIAADGRWLALRSGERSGVGVRIADQPADRDLSWLDNCVNPSLSRDGQRLLFTDNNAGANYGVVWRKTDGSPIVRLGPGLAQGFSPDEKWVLALLNTPPQLILYPLTVGEPVHVPRGAIVQYQAAAWFPDGRSLLVVGNERSKATRAYRQVLPDGLPMPLLPEGVTPAAITPDGEAILATDVAHAWQWYPTSGAASRPAMGFGTVTDLAVVGWTTDGKSLLVRIGLEVPAKVESIEIATGRRRLVGEVAPTDRTGLVKLSPATVSHDGRQYAYQYYKRLSTVFVVSGAK